MNDNETQVMRKDHTFYMRMPDDEIGGNVEPTIELVELLEEYSLNLGAVKALDMQRAIVVQRLAHLMKACDKVGHLATWKSAAPIDRLRGAELRESYPKIYEDFVNRPPRRIFYINLQACQKWLDDHAGKSE